MTLQADTPRRLRAGTSEVGPVGVALVVAELLLAALWFPWVAEHLVLSSPLSGSYGALRALIVGPEYALLAVAVWLVALTASRRPAAAALALAAGLLSWGVSVLLSSLLHTPADLQAHHRLTTFLGYTVLLGVPALATLAWGVARRVGSWWLVSVPVAAGLHWWIERTDWLLRATAHGGFRVSEALGMTLAITPVLLAILCGWAAEQVERSRGEVA
jgi:hypothetical protein